MLLSQEKRFLFIHIQKTGGTSITKMFKEEIKDLKSYRNPHSPLSAMEKRYEAYYKAAFVRNPYDRILSWYTMIDNMRKQLSPEQMDQHKNKVQREVMLNADSFTGFVLNCEYVTSRSGWLPFHKNQIDYLSNENGEVAIDFIGRFEHLADDVEKLRKRLGLSHVHLPHVNRSKHHAYQSYYTEETKQIIAKRFERDLEYFKYQF
ncbi:sulfotransferase family 2 domain-containing protein [Sulfurovum sp.]|uniref:sulfotransferase family 2 domain-containing protein n=1 Tax=Sulfurovum sp. TaxID=1969726 RepID=UPI0025D05C3B|nr:sulfotransferase family 2 domain-containing protein [Sulfurovum sp.]